MKIEMRPVESSQIKAVGYDAAKKTLAIEFMSGGLYHYANVTPDMFSEMMLAPSLGSYFYKNIKANKEKFPFTKQLSEA